MWKPIDAYFNVLSPAHPITALFYNKAKILRKVFAILKHLPWLFGSGKFSRATKCMTVVFPGGSCKAVSTEQL